LGVTKTLNNIQQRYYWLQARNNVDSGAASVTPVQYSHGTQTRNQRQMHQYNIRTLFERIAIDVAGPFPWSNQENRYLLIVTDYFMKWLEAYAIPKQEGSTVAEALVTNFFCHFEVPWELYGDQERNFKFHVIQEVLQCLE
jgi:hypothetical protein